MIVMKFGGTSVGNAEIIKSVADIIKSNLNKNPIVVVSAVAGITNTLIKLSENLSSSAEVKKLVAEIKQRHEDIIIKLGIERDVISDIFNEFVGTVTSHSDADAELLDLISCYGERFSVRIVSAYLNKVGILSKPFDAWEIGMITTDVFGNAEPLDVEREINKQLTKIKVIPVITGFIGKTKNSKVTTLGRGGSDYTAAIIGSAINAEEIQIWTDVNGIMSADPKVVKNAKYIDVMLFEEAAELAYFGARVLHPKTILPAVKSSIPVRVLNTFNPRGDNTLILNECKSSDIIKAIASKKNITVINIASTRMLNAYGFLSRVFEIFRANKKSVDMVSTSEVSISLTIDNMENIDKIIAELKEIADVSSDSEMAIICVVGSGMKHTPGIAGRIFSILGKNKINVEMISQGASEINISFIVKNHDADKTVQLLHKEFFES